LKNLVLLCLGLFLISVSGRAASVLPSYPPETRQERNDRLNKLYQPFVGKYTGVATFADGDPKTLEFTMTVNVKDEKTADGVMPMLTAWYQRSDDPRGELALTFDVYIDRTTEPTTILWTSRPYPGPPNQYKITISSHVEKDVITGKITMNFGNRTTTVTMKKSE
jgi:hypothetical protein